MEEFNIIVLKLTDEQISHLVFWGWMFVSFYVVPKLIDKK